MKTGTEVVFMQNNACAVILAGGEGKRMKSGRPKVLAQVLFKPMIEWVIDAVREAGISDICVVTGSKREYLDEYLRTLPFEVETVFQSERLGTGHAVMTASDFLEKNRGKKVFILSGDAPFISAETLSAALEAGAESACTVISAELDNPFGYGRMIRQDDGVSLKCIVEEKEATDEIRKVREVNSGVYCFDCDALLSALGRLTKSPKTGEYYLTDTIEILQKDGLSVIAFKAENADSVLGANDGVQLAGLNEIARKRILEAHMKNGVVIPCTDGVMIGKDVAIGANTVILPATVVRGKVNIGSFCELGPAVVIENTDIPDGTVVRPARS